MTESMMEKLARVIDPVAFMPMSVHPSKELRQASIDQAMDQARAVLLALREPDDGLRVSGGLAMEEAWINCEPGETIFDGFGKAFTAAIDHILNESGQPANPT